jgi:hypothetical protein
MVVTCGPEYLSPMPGKKKKINTLYPILQLLPFAVISTNKTIVHISYKTPSQQVVKS